MTNSAKGLALSLKDCIDETGIGLNALYDAIRKDLLKARKIGRRTIVLRADLEAYLNALPPLDLNEGKHTPACRNMTPVGRRKRVGKVAA